MDVVSFVQWLTEWDLSAVLTCNIDMALPSVRDLTAYRDNPGGILNHYNEEPFDPTMYVFREPKDDFRRGQLLVGLELRLRSIFDWPDPTPVPNVSFELQLSRSLIRGLLTRIADFADGRIFPPMTEQPGDLERIRSILPESTGSNIRSVKRLAWVGSRIRGRYRDIVPKLEALGDEFYPQATPGPTFDWKKPALATAGVLAALGIIGGGVAAYKSRSRSRTKRRPQGR